jgi:dihydrofolate reductase
MSRKLKLQVQISVDGFIAGPNGEMDWMTWNWDEDLKDYVNKITRPVDTIILGRKLAEGFIPYWTNVTSDSNNPEFAFAKIMTDTPKVVFTKTLDKSTWANTDLAKGNLVTEINSLKNKRGNDIIVYGGSSFVSSLISEKLIDEFHLFVNPTIIGNGMPIFREINSRQNLLFVRSQGFECGISILVYTLRK